MAGRIIFEEDIASQSPKVNKKDKDTVNQEVSMDNGEDNLMEIELPSTVNNDNNSTQELQKSTPPLRRTTDPFLSQTQDVNDENPQGNSEGNMEQVNNAQGNTDNEGNINQNNQNKDETNAEQMDSSIDGSKFDQKVLVNTNQSSADDPNKGNKGKGKKRPSELELLGVDKKENIEDMESKYDVYGDDSKVYRKYRLRKSEHPISYKEPSDWKLERRISEDVKPISLECTICYREFDNTRALNSHNHTHRTVSEYICSLCFEKFKTNADLIAHKSTHTTEAFLCKICRLAFSDHCDYLLHMLTHATQSHFKCPECGLKLPKTSYRIHIYTHFNKKVNCPLCLFVCNGEFNLQQHLNRHKYELACVECGKNCNSKKYYEYHMSVHTGVKKYQCLYCGKAFGTESMRKVHTRSHTGEKPYTCDICGYKTAQTTDLKRHKVTHEAEKRYTCDLCQKKFFHKESLVSHMRVHTRRSLYKCPECDGEFLSVRGLKCHLMYKHLTDRPAACNVCDKKFINNNQLQKHMRSKYHKRNMYGLMTKMEDE